MNKDNKLEHLSAVQLGCYKRAMKLLEDVFMNLCNANGPLGAYEYQNKVLVIIQEAKDKINKLIK